MRSKVRKYEDVEINRVTHTVRVNGQPVHLCYKEFQLLWLLLEHKGCAVPMKEIKRHLWGDEWAVMEEAVACHVSRIREKLGPSGKMILNVPKFGYRVKKKSPPPPESVR